MKMRGWICRRYRDFCFDGSVYRFWSNWGDEVVR